MRLDHALTQRHLAHSRTQAQKYIHSGQVCVDGKIVTKPSYRIDSEQKVDIEKPEKYVSRAAYKLMGALEYFRSQGYKESTELLDIKGQRCLDIGASTGGFTQVLLEEGAKEVTAVDVGQEQMNLQIAEDQRVVVYEKTNFRYINGDDLGGKFQRIVCDVSFISLTLLMENIAESAGSRASILLMVKPQFEVGRAQNLKKGIVVDPQNRWDAIDAVINSAQKCGLEYLGHYENDVSGEYGNIESFVWLKAPEV